MTCASEDRPPCKNEETDAARVCRTAQILIVMLATILHGVFLSKAKPLQSANDRSRWCTVWSLVEKETFQIDEIRQRSGWDTIDLIHVDGHFYSTKPPLLTTIVAGMTWCVQKVTGWDLINQPQSVTFVVLLLVNLLPFVISLLAWIAILDSCSSRTWTRLFVLTIASFGTLTTPFLMTLNNHTVAVASATIALCALLRILKDKRELPAAWLYVLCGFATSWTAANELPAASLAAIALVVAYRSSVKKTVLCFLPAAAVPFAALIITNVIATGSWKPVYADYGSDKYRFVIDGIPSYWMHPHGVDRNLDSPWMYFVHCTVGHHGLFSLTPIALLALVAWVTSFRIRDRALRTLILAGAATSAIVLAFYMTRTQNYNYGGVSCGLRWAIWLTPLWLLAVVPVLDVISKSGMMRIIAMLLAMISIYSAWQPIENPWRQPWLFQWMESRGWIDYSDEPPELPKPLWTWFSRLPNPSDVEPVWIEFSVMQRGVSPRFVRLTGRRDDTDALGERLEIEIRETNSDLPESPEPRTILIDIRKFNDGSPPAEFLRWADPKVTAAQQQADLAFVRGLPRKVPYQARSIRYLKTHVRNEAFECIFAAAHVGFAANESDAPLTYRCDVWLTDDVPFGVAQVEFHISQTESAAVMLHERWIVRDCWPKPAQFKPQMPVPTK